MNGLWRWAPVTLLALSTLTMPAAGQVADPKSAFTNALGQFSVELDGSYGDEGSGIRSSLESMAQGLAQWDGVIRTYEMGMAAEIGGAERSLAARMHMALGGVYLDRNRIKDALREFAEAIRLDATRADAHSLQGLTYSQLGTESKAAAEAFRAASTLDARNPVRAYLLAQHLMKVGTPAEAQDALQHFVDIQLQQPTSRDVAAVASPFIRLGLTQEVAGVEPFFAPALYAKGFALLQEGDYERAIVQFKEAADRDPLTSVTPASDTMSRASTAFRSGQIELALQQLSAAVALAPNRGEPHRLLGLVYLAGEQLEKGVTELRSAVRLSPADERAHLALADALTKMEQFPAAEQALREAIKAVPASGRARYRLGLLYQRQGQYPEALDKLDEAVTFKPLLGLNSLYQTIGALRRARQDFEGATQAFANRVELIPNTPEAHRELGDAYFRRGLDVEAIAELSVALMLNPRDAEAYAALAQLHLRAGRYGDAVDSSQHVLGLDPGHKQARYALATSLMRLGRTDEGKRELEVFERLQQEEAAARLRQFELGRLRREATLSAAAQDYEKAVALRREVLRLAPDDAATHLELGLALIRAGQPAEAIERFKAAAALNAPIDVHRHLSDAYAAAGQLAESQRERALYERLKQDVLRRAGTGR